MLCHFPESVDLALGWTEVNPHVTRKILWDNAVLASRGTLNQRQSR